MYGITLVGLRDDLEVAAAVAEDEGIRCSSIVELDREESALHNPLIVDMGEIASTISLIFGAGTSAIVFVDTLLDALGKHRPLAGRPPLQVGDASTNESLGSTDESDIDQLRSRLREREERDTDAAESGDPRS